MAAKKPSPMALSKAIGRYLEECASGRRANAVSLGALPGFPAWSNDPAVVEKAALVADERAENATSPVVRLEYMQRARDLRASAEELRLEDAGESDRDLFVRYGAEWASTRKWPVSYETFRDAGVPAADLKAAGITRGGA